MVFDYIYFSCCFYMEALLKVDIEIIIADIIIAEKIGKLVKFRPPLTQHLLRTFKNGTILGNSTFWTDLGYIGSWNNYSWAKKQAKVAKNTVKQPILHS